MTKQFVPPFIALWTGQPPVPEYKFHPERQWRADFAWPTERVIVEFDGGNHLIRYGTAGQPVAVGRHTQADDYWKLSTAAALGWKVLRFTNAMWESNPLACVQLIELALAQDSNP